jgi:hypothetical protein
MEQACARTPPNNLVQSATALHLFVTRISGSLALWQDPAFPWMMGTNSSYCLAQAPTRVRNDSIHLNLPIEHDVVSYLPDILSYKLKGKK